MKFIVRIILPSIALTLSTTLSCLAQSPQDAQPNSVAAGEAPDVTRQLSLTPDQLFKIRQVQRDSKDERVAIGVRLRQSNRALQEALDAESLDESLVEQRLQDLAAAQTAQLRMRIQTELKIRRLLSPAQLARWRELRLQAGDVMRAQDNNQRPNRPRPGLGPGQRNGIAPLEPRRNEPPRNPRP